MHQNFVEKHVFFRVFTEENLQNSRFFAKFRKFRVFTDRNICFWPLFGPEKTHFLQNFAKFCKIWQFWTNFSQNSPHETARYYWKWPKKPGRNPGCAPGRPPGVRRVPPTRVGDPSHVKPPETRDFGVCKIGVPGVRRRVDRWKIVYTTPVWPLFCTCESARYTRKCRVCTVWHPVCTPGRPPGVRRVTDRSPATPHDRKCPETRIFWGRKRGVTGTRRWVDRWKIINTTPVWPLFCPCATARYTWKCRVHTCDTRVDTRCAHRWWPSATGSF